MRLPARTLDAVLVLGTSLLASGCYTYAPVESPSPGSIMRVHVPLTSALDDPNAPPETVSIEGTVLSASDTISLATRSRREIGAFREIIEFDTLRLDVASLAGMEVREFSAAKSIILAAAITGAAAAFAIAALSYESGRGGDDGEGGGPVTLSSVVARGLASAVLSLISN